MIELLDELYIGRASPEDGGGGGESKKKYGASIDVLIGNISQDGMLQIPNVHADLVFSGVKSIASQALMDKFKNSGVTSATFPDLEKLHTASAMERAFAYTLISSITMDKVKQITASRCLAECCMGTHIASLSFPALEDVGQRTDQFTDMLKGVTGCAVHFPAALESKMSSWTDVQNGFGGNNTTILFDL